MISLKKYLEMQADDLNVPVKVKEAQAHNADRTELLAAFLESYRSALLAIGNSGAQACPAVSGNLQQNLKTLESRLEGDLTAPLVRETGQHLSDQLRQWGEEAAAHSESEVARVKELLIVLAQTAASVGDRDQNYAKTLNQFTGRLAAISNLNDLSQIRTSLVQHATDLKAHIEKMERESSELVTQLQTKVSTYETKLKEVEEFALRDSLTGLANRRRIEEHIASRVALGKIFSLVVVDMNRLKSVNDTHGHLAGDSLLQQFAQELRSSFRTSDLVGRWGGDEFIIVIDCETAGAQAQIERMQKWVFGSYTIRPGKGTGEVKLNVDAAVGLAEWKPGETAQALIDHADAAMYAQKAPRKKQK